MPTAMEPVRLSAPTTRAVEESRVGAGMVLEGTDGHEGESNVGAVSPREGLVLDHLHGEVHAGLVALEPGGAGLLVGVVALVDDLADELEVLGEVVGAEIL